MADPQDLNALSFEDALQRLERIVQRLENGEASLEESIDIFTQGVSLKRHCEAKLAAAQARIEKIQIAADGSVKGLAPLDTE
jgi:exodeoxyribonuclease VII small subunit